MLLIFSFSSDKISSQRSSRIIGPIVHWLFPNMSPQRVGDIVFAVRKCAHGAEYAIFAMLLWRARNRPTKLMPGRWDWSEARTVLILAAMYAATDELHQVFVPNRQGSVVDVLIDTCGALGGLIFLWRFGRWRKRWA
jgi:VanZ family protein